jgi:hypothetical protein
MSPLRVVALQVMFAEPLGARSATTSSNGAAPPLNMSTMQTATSLPNRSPGVMSMQASTPSAAHTPLSSRTGTQLEDVVGCVIISTVTA